MYCEGHLFKKKKKKKKKDEENKKLSNSLKIRIFPNYNSFIISNAVYAYANAFFFVWWVWDEVEILENARQRVVEISEIKLY